MRICVLGATGPSGLQVVDQALKQGFEVYAVVRNPLKIQQKHENLKVFKTDIFSTECLEDVMEGCYAVVSCLGTKPGFSPVSLYTDSAQAIVGAMRRMGIKRFVCMTSWYTQDQDDMLFVMKWIIKPLFLGRILENMYAMEMYLQSDCQDIDYTVVRPPGLTNVQKEDKEVVYEEDAFHVKNSARRMPRANVAAFMLDSIENEKHYRKILGIAMKN